MCISKYELITEVVRLFDELDACRRDLADLERGIAACSDVGKEKPVNPVDLICLKAGRQKLFDDCTCSWRSVTAARDEETGEIKVTGFRKFRASVTDRCPDSMSRNEFFEYFDSEFHALYEEKKAMAISELEAKEADDD